MDSDTRNLFARMIGGDEDRFFRDNWRKRTYFSKSCCPELRGIYSSIQFLRDCQEHDCGQGTLSISVGKGQRAMSSFADWDGIVDALDNGRTIVLQALVVPTDTSELPEQWTRFRSLHRALAEYLFPGFPLDGESGAPISAVDFFLSSVETCTGGHYDTGDVFYFVLEGEKEWTVEHAPNLERGISFALEQAHYDLAPTGQFDVMRVKPGDCLYIPPYTYHRVRSTGEALAVSLGLPAFSEVHLLMRLFADIRKATYLYEPLPSFPSTQSSLLEIARIERKTIRHRTVEEIRNRLAGQP